MRKGGVVGLGNCKELLDETGAANWTGLDRSWKLQGSAE